MKLETYIQAIRNSPKKSTEFSLSLDGLKATTNKPDSYSEHGIPDRGTLLERLHAVQQKAEDDVLEYGCNLHWNAGAIRLGKLYQGTKTKVSLKTRKAIQKDSYLGDFHVHPYQKKGSPDAMIGPSIDDMEGWVEDWHQPGARHHAARVGLFIVFAGKALCISIFRDVTKSIDQLTGTPYTKIDFIAAGQEAEKIMPGFRDRLASCQNEINHQQSIELERAIWDSVPTHAPTFSAANKQMNQEFANAHSYEYFIADTSENPVVARLVSLRTHTFAKDTACVIV